MMLEQLVTAGTITEYEIWKLRRRYKKLLQSHERSTPDDLEAQRPKPGVLTIGYFRPTREGRVGTEPLKSHLKLTIVDGEVVVLGSGNMDRASWYTSQELGVAFVSREVAALVRESVESGLEGRVRFVC